MLNYLDSYVSHLSHVTSVASDGWMYEWMVFYNPFGASKIISMNNLIEYTAEQARSFDLRICYMEHACMCITSFLCPFCFLIFSLFSSLSERHTCYIRSCYSCNP